MNVHVTIEIDGSAEKVWNTITDFEHCGAVISGIIRSEVLHRPEAGLVGLQWCETREMFGKEASETMTVTEAVEGKYYCTQAENHGALYVTRLSIDTLSDNRVQLSMTFSATSQSMWIRLLSGCLSIFMKKSITKLLKQDLADIKRFIEGND